MKIQQKENKNQSKINKISSKQQNLDLEFKDTMSTSTGYLSRTNRNTPQRNLIKSESVTEETTNPSQLTNVASQEPNKTGYVYKPPTRIVRSNANQAKQPVTQKVQQKKTEQKTENLPPSTPVKNTPFVRKPQNQTPNLTKQEKNQSQNKVEQKKIQTKPITNPISRLNSNRQTTVQQKLQPQQKIKNEEQNPKFSRIKKVQQQAQNTQSTPNLPYQRKGLNQTPQISQPITSSRISKNQIQTPSQKLQAPTPQKIQTIKKPLGSQASRYNNKIQTPKDQQKTQEEERPQIKRSNLIIFILKKLFVSKQQSNFQQIVSFSLYQKQTQLNERSLKQFQRTLQKFCTRYESGLCKYSLALMKNIYSKLSKIQMNKALDPKFSNLLISKRNQCFVRVLQNVTVSEITQKRWAFNLLKKQVESQRVKERKMQIGAKVLCNIEFKKMRQHFIFIHEWSSIRNSIKSLKISRCSEIQKIHVKEILFKAFRNMEIFKVDQLKKSIVPKNTVKSTLNKQKQVQSPSKFLQANKELKQKVAQLQKRIAQLKQNSDQNQDEELRVTVQSLKDQNLAISGQLEVKKQRNIQLKQKLQSIMVNKPFNSQDQFSSTSQNKMQNEESTLSLLHQIYMKVFKQSQEQCGSEENLISLYNIHRVEENRKERKTVAQWLAVQENLALKNWINLYEGSFIYNNADVETSSILQRRNSQLKKLQQENEIISKFIRSYIKERYMWEEVKQYVAAVIQE